MTAAGEIKGLAADALREARAAYKFAPNSYTFTALVAAIRLEAALREHDAGRRAAVP